jgi:hypothetical protein
MAPPGKGEAMSEQGVTRCTRLIYQPAPGHNLPFPKSSLQAALRLALARSAAIVRERERAADAELGEPVREPHGRGANQENNERPAQRKIA